MTTKLQTTLGMTTKLQTVFWMTTKLAKNVLAMTSE